MANKLYQYGYYLPFFFQSVQGTSATTSGVRYIAMMIPQIVSLVVTGIIVTKFGYYVSIRLLNSVFYLMNTSLGAIHDCGWNHCLYWVRSLDYH